MTEQTFFDEGGVTVTNARFIVPSQTYAMSGVTSVKSLRRNPSRKGSIVLIVLGLLAMWIDIFVGLLIIGGGVIWWVVSKPLYAIVLSSASGEAEVFSSMDATFISRIVNALNEAIVARG